MNIQVIDKKTGEVYFPERKSKKDIKVEVDKLDNKQLLSYFNVSNYLRKFIEDYEKAVKDRIKSIAESKMNDDWSYTFENEIPVTKVAGSKKTIKVFNEQKLESEGTEQERRVYKHLMDKYSEEKVVDRKSYLKVGR